MEKKYIKPEMKILYIETNKILAASSVSVGGTIDNPGGAESRWGPDFFNFWDF